MLQRIRSCQDELGYRDGVMTVDGIVNSNSEVFFSIVERGVDIQFPLCLQQLLALRAHMLFEDLPAVLPHSIISSI